MQPSGTNPIDGDQRPGGPSSGDAPGALLETVAAYRPMLDVVRFLAAIWVMLSHARAVKGGGVAVSVFFVLSGYLIGGLLVAEKRRTGRIELTEFYFKRLLRIWVPYYIVLAFVFGLFVARGQWAAPGFHERTFAALTYTYNLINDIRGDIHPIWGSFNQIWSLSIEEQFYLVAPLLIGALPAGLIAPACLALAAVSLKVSPLYGGLFMGVLMAALTSRRQAAPKDVPPSARAGLIAAFLAASIALFVSGQQGADQASLQTYLLSCVIVLTAYYIPMPQRTHGVLRTLGLMTYSYYLIHTLPAYFLSAVYRRVTGHAEWSVGMGILVSLLALPISYAFVRWIELPTLRLRSRMLKGRSPLIAYAPYLAWGVSLIGIAGLIYAAGHRPW